jgi:hypothetical protein
MNHKYLVSLKNILGHNNNHRLPEYKVTDKKNTNRFEKIEHSWELDFVVVRQVVVEIVEKLVVFEIGVDLDLRLDYMFYQDLKYIH